MRCVVDQLHDFPPQGIENRQGDPLRFRQRIGNAGGWIEGVGIILEELEVAGNVPGFDRRDIIALESPEIRRHAEIGITQINPAIDQITVFGKVQQFDFRQAAVGLARGISKAGIQA